MSLETRSIDEIRDDIIAAVNVADSDINTAEGSDCWITANALAGPLAELQARDVELSRATLPSTATGTDLDEHATVWLGDDTRRAATQWFGTITFNAEGSATPIVAAGTTATASDGTQYETVGGIAAADWAAGVATTTAKSVDDEIGTVANKAVNTPLIVDTPPAGCSSDATIASTTTAAVDEEDDETLRGRILVVTAGRPGAGNAADYVRWAGEVSGVWKAFAYPRWDGLGTVTVVPLREDGNHIISAGTVLTAVQTKLDAERPCGVVVYAEAATASQVTVTPTILLQDGYGTDWSGTFTTAATANHTTTRVYVTADPTATISVGSWIVVPIGTNDFSCARQATNVQTGASHFIEVDGAFVDEDGTATAPAAAGGKTVRPGSFNYNEIIAAIKGAFDDAGPSASASPGTTERYPGPSVSSCPHIYLSDIHAAIDNVEGVIACTTLAAPAANQTNTAALAAGLTLLTFNPAVVVTWASL